jgi:hypothetical protein
MGFSEGGLSEACMEGLREDSNELIFQEPLINWEVSCDISFFRFCMV